MADSRIKSSGHLGWFRRPDGTLSELYSERGALWTASEHSVIDMDTGNRIGRWEAPGHMLYAVERTFQLLDI